MISPLVAGNNFTDTIGATGMQHYMVRAAKNMLTPSGTYINLSEGITDSMFVHFHSAGVQNENMADEISVFPNPTKDILNIKSEMLNLKSISVYDIFGREIFHSSISTINYQLSTINSPLSIPLSLLLLHLFVSSTNNFQS